MAFKGQAQRRCKFVGKFFQSFGKQLMRANLPKIDSEDARLRIEGNEIGFEIKGTGNNDPARIRLAQLERFSRMAQGFPFDFFVYLLFCYRNRQETPKPGMRRRKRNRILSSCGDDEKVCRALLDNLSTVFIFDHRALEAARDCYGVARRGYPYDPKQQTTAIPRTLLQDLSNGHASRALAELKLSPTQWTTWHQKVRVKTYLELPLGKVVSSMIDLQVVHVVPADLKPLLEKVIKPTNRNIVARHLRFSVGELQALIAAA
jgi:hypothetical protein